MDYIFMALLRGSLSLIGWLFIIWLVWRLIKRRNRVLPLKSEKKDKWWHLKLATSKEEVLSESFFSVHLHSFGCLRRH